MVFVAEIVGVSVSPKMPNQEEVRKTLVLGSMKKAKMAGIDQIKRTVASDKKKEVETFKSLGFTAPDNAKTEVRGSNTKLVRLTVDTIGINPDPKKRFS